MIAWCSTVIGLLAFGFWVVWLENPRLECGQPYRDFIVRKPWPLVTEEQEKS